MKTILIRMKHRASINSGPERRTRGRETLLGVLTLAAALTLFLLLTAALCRPLAGLLSNPPKLRAAVLRRGFWGTLLFWGLEVAQGFLPIPLEVTTVAAGYIFGPAAGLFLTVASVCSSTTLIFTLAKIFGRRFFLFLFPHGENPWILRNEKARAWAAWFVFLIPGLPKRLFIFSAALVPQKFSRFLLVSTAARIPVLLACSFGGGALGSGNYWKAAFLFCVVAVPAVLAFFIWHAATAKNRKP